MSNDLNNCSFIGRLGRDPEIKYMPSGDAVANVSLAVGWKTKEKEGTEWIPVVFFGKTAEIVGKYLTKGSQLYVSGRFRTRKWTDKDGNDRYTSEIVADRMQMLGGGKRDEGDHAPQKDGDDFGDSDIPF